MIHSFDVFDTVLTRRVPRPEDAFVFLAHRIARDVAPDWTPDAVLAARVEAEIRANAWHRDSTELAHIAQQLAALLGLPRGCAGELARLEEEVEESLVVPIPAAVELVAEARRRGRVIFVSDTCLPSRFVARILRTGGVAERSEPVYVSCEAGATKSSGRLFLHAAAREGVRLSSIVHHGNDFAADVRAARRTGARSRLLDAGNLTRYERLLADNLGRRTRSALLWAGAARIARLEHDGAVPDELVAPAAGVFAPAITAYVARVLELAERDRLRTLFFASREGQVMLEVARVLGETRSLDVELRYLYGSRKVWAGPQLPESTRSQLAAAIADEPYGVVDVGWRGRHTAAFMRALGTVGARAPDRLYLFGQTDRDPTGGAERARAFVTDVPEREGYPLSWHVIPVLEGACSADHGSVIAFEAERPVFGPSVTGELAAWGHGELRGVIRSFAASWARAAAPTGLTLDELAVGRSIARVLEGFAVDPEPAEARFWARLPCDPNLPPAQQRLGVPYGAGDVLRQLLGRHRNAEERRLWVAGARLSSSLPVSLGWRAARRGGAVLRTRAGGLRPYRARLKALRGKPGAV
jgi:FMN phosphatase YigB (HAD superfamily)